MFTVKIRKTVQVLGKPNIQRNIEYKYAKMGGTSLSNGSRTHMTSQPKR